jgi:6-pyruvoyltetrahydropterin/6-carboxytetrahydropterin synthase
MLLTRRMEFSSSHRLWRGEWDDARNHAVFGRHAGPTSHGHNYELEVTVDGSVDGETGMVIDLKRLKDVMDAEIGERFDHRDLNDDTGLFEQQQPTAEVFAGVIFGLLDRALPDGMLSYVPLRPTPDYEVEARR